MHAHNESRLIGILFQFDRKWSMHAAMSHNAKTVAGLFLDRVSRTPELEAYRHPGRGEGWVSLSWRDVRDRVAELAQGLVALGLEAEGRVAILAGTRIEWVLADLAVNCAGGATTAIYPSTTAEDCAYILRDSATRIVFAEDAAQGA